MFWFGRNRSLELLSVTVRPGTPMHPGARSLIQTLGQIVPNTEALSGLLAAPAPGLQYLVLFTPRSGSSWLTELLSTNPGFGQPGEWFNDSLVPDIARHFGVDNIYDYVGAVTRTMCDPQTRVFGAEITFFQLEVMRQLVDFFQHFPLHRTKLFYLNRRDIIAQAVSLYRAVKSGVFHAADATDDAASVPYDADQIAHWLTHIRRQELGVEALIEEAGVTVERLRYEDMMAEEPARVVDRFSRVLHGADYGREVIAPAAHKKLRSHETSAWIERFEADKSDLCASIADERRAEAGAVIR